MILKLESYLYFYIILHCGKGTRYSDYFMNVNNFHTPDKKTNSLQVSTEPEHRETVAKLE